MNPTPCDYGNHTFCGIECECACHDEGKSRGRRPSD